MVPHEVSAPLHENPAIWVAAIAAIAGVLSALISKWQGWRAAAKEEKQAEYKLLRDDLAWVRGEFEIMKADHSALQKEVKEIREDNRNKERRFNIAVDEYYKVIYWFRRKYPDDDQPDTTIMDELTKP